VTAGTVDSRSESDDDEYSEAEQAAHQRYLNRKACLNMVVFAAFLTTFTVVTLLTQSVESSRFADRIREKVERGEMPLKDVTTHGKFWNFMRRSLVPAIYKNDTDTRMAYSQSPALHPVDVSNRLLGGIRMRQLRVDRKDNCAVGGLFTAYVIQCYGQYNRKLSESRAPYGPKERFVWTEDDGTGAVFAGMIAEYSPHGFLEYFGSNKTKTVVTLNQLQADGYVDSGTRAVLVDFTVWSSNLGSYAVSRLAFEFAPSGAVQSQLRVLIMSERALSPSGTGSSGDWLSIIGELVIILFVLYYLAEELSELSVERWNYLTDFWNILDWVNMFLLLYSFGIRCTNFIDASDLSVGEQELQDNDTYTNLQPFAERSEEARLLNSFNAVLLWAKCVKYTRFMPYVKILMAAVQGCFDVFFAFLLMFAAIFMGFVVSYNIGFGDKILELATFTGAMIYLCRAFLGDVDMLPVYRVSPLFGALLILLFYVGIMMVALNVFFSILVHSMHEAKYRADEQEGEVDLRENMIKETWEQLKNWVQNTLDIEKRLRVHAPALHRRLFKKTPKMPPPPALAAAQPAGTKPAGIQLAALEDRKGKRRKGPRTSSSTSSSSSSTSSSSVWNRARGPKPVSAFTAVQVMKSVEHMAGRLLSKIQGIGIEIRTEILDVFDKLTTMNYAIGELVRRAKKIQEEQETLMQG
jgi:hypothetical protein